MGPVKRRKISSTNNATQRKILLRSKQPLTYLEVVARTS